MATEDGLEAVTDLREQAVTAGGTVVRVQPLRVGQLPAFVHAIKPVVALVQGGQVDILGLLTEHPEALINAVAIGTGQSREFLDALQLDELVALGAAVVEINGDFFARRVMPIIQRLTQRSAGAGLTASNA